MKRFFTTGCTIALFNLSLAVLPAAAATLPQAEQIVLQVAMQGYLDDVSFNGAIRQIDAASGNVVEYFPSKAHPKIMVSGDIVIMCGEFVDASGKNVMGNFYMAKRDTEYVVFQASFGHDPVIEKLEHDGKIEMAN